MKLPQELLDEIHGHQDDKQSLRNFSLVSKPWLDPSRRRLFETVKIRQETLESWWNIIPPTNDGVLRHVRSLTYLAAIDIFRTLFPSEYCLDVIREYFPSLPQLRHFSLGSRRLNVISRDIDMFSPFRHTLVRLSLEHRNVKIGTFVTLINYFPNLNRLDLSGLFRMEDYEPTPPLSRQLLRELHVRGGDLDANFLDRLSELGLAFEEIVLNAQPIRVQPVERIVNAVGVSVKRLRLLDPLETCMCITLETEPTARRTEHSFPSDNTGTTTLSRCQELQELEMILSYPGEEIANIISSITSTSIRKMTFVHNPWVGCRSYHRYHTAWEKLGNHLCRFVDRLGCERELEVDFRPTRRKEQTGKPNVLESLTEFREKCGVRVFWDGSESVVSSDAVV